VHRECEIPNRITSWRGGHRNNRAVVDGHNPGHTLVSVPRILDITGHVDVSVTIKSYTPRRIGYNHLRPTFRVIDGRVYTTRIWITRIFGTFQAVVAHGGLINPCAYTKDARILSGAGITVITRIGVEVVLTTNTWSTEIVSARVAIITVGRFQARHTNAFVAIVAYGTKFAVVAGSIDEFVLAANKRNAGATVADISVITIQSPGSRLTLPFITGIPHSTRVAIITLPRVIDV